MSHRRQKRNQYNIKPDRTASGRDTSELKADGKVLPSAKGGNLILSGRLFSKNILGVPAWQAALLLVLTILVFLLYFRTLARTLPTGDSGDLIAAAWNLGIPHPPGYPTVTMLGHLFSLLPWGTPAFRVNLSSAVLDSLAIFVLGLGLLRLFSASFNKQNGKTEQIILITGTIAGTGLLAVSNGFWAYSTVAEVFALNNLFTAIILVLMLEWVRQPKKWWFLRFAALFSGLGLTNQLTIGLLAPGLLVLLIAGIVRWRRGVSAELPKQQSVSGPAGWNYPLRETAIAVIFFAAGLIPYIYLPIAARTDTPVNWGNPGNLTNFIDVLLRRDYGTFSFDQALEPGNRGQQLTFICRYLYGNFTLAGIILAGLGIFRFTRKQQIEGAGAGLAFLVSGPLFMVLANPPLDNPLYQGAFQRFYIMPGILFIFFIAAGAVLVLQWAGGLKFNKKAKALVPNVLVTLGLAVAVLWPACLAFARLPVLDLRDDRINEYFGRDLLEPLEPDSILLLQGDIFYMSVIYQQTVLGFRNDVIVLQPRGLSSARWYIDRQSRLHPEIVIPASTKDRTAFIVSFVKANSGNRTIYGAGLGEYDKGLTGNFDEVYSGLVFRFVPKGEGTDQFALLRSRSDYFSGQHFPDKVYPATAWESEIGRTYGYLASEIGFSKQKEGKQPDAAFVEKMYRIAILNNPDDYFAYWNLTVLLWNNGGSPDEIRLLAQKSLDLAPDQESKDKARSFLDFLLRES
jgi:hypothetical protein